MTDDDAQSDLARPRRIGFLLLDGFALMSYASAVEPLRAANVLAGRTLYAWPHFTIGPGAAASGGQTLAADGRVGADARLDALLVCAGGNPARFRHGPTLGWLRGLARRGTALGGVSGGPFVLARAGLLGGYRCTVHWEHAPAFAEAFPDLDLTGSLYEIDRDRFTCAGGVAALDMMHALVARDHGDGLADEVADWFLQTQVRDAADAQRRTLQARFGVANPHLLRALGAIESRIEAPPTRTELAALAGVSVRQLERLFAAHLGTTIERHGQAVRLRRAQNLLRQSAMSVAAISVATGFASPSHFSRRYRATYGRPPQQERNRRP